MRVIILTTVVLASVALPHAAGAAGDSHGCRSFSSHGFAPGQIQAKNMSCAWAHAWIDQVTGRVFDQSPLAVQHAFRLRDGRFKLRCVGRLQQGEIDPYLHVSCRAGNRATAGQALTFNVGS
jgi:hypothetical protein